MSLIFQSLQKLEPEPDSHPFPAGREAPTLTRPAAKYLARMRPVAVWVMLVPALGWGAVYGVQYLKDRLPMDTAAADTPTISAPIRRPVNDPQAATPHSTSPQIATAVEKARFYPPQEPSQAMTDAEPQSVAKVVPATGGIAGPNEMSPEPKAGEHDSEARTVAPVPMDRKTGSVNTAEADTVRAARRAAQEKQARIERLVRQIEESLAGTADSHRTADLLERLARFKGRDHPYVAKLRAYWHFKRKQYVLAEADLQKVIAAHPGDLEAGINLALIEIHNQAYPTALERLKQLRRIHPENTAVADLIKRLR